MDLGIALPTAGNLGPPEAIRRTAQEAERLGLASVWTFERLLRPTEPVAPDGGAAPVPVPDVYANVEEPIETLAYVAGVTDRIRLGTSVIGTLFHPPVVLARRLAALDRLSGGRLLAGLGQGWIPQEFTAAGVPMARRGAGFQEHIEAMRAVWGPDPVRFAGRFYRIPESQIGPKPLRAGGPELLLGAKTAVAARRAGRMGLGLNPAVGFNSPFGSLEELGGFIDGYRREAKAAGHDPGALPVVLRVNGPITEAPLPERAPLIGSAEQVCEDLDRVEAAGIGHVFWAMPTGPDEQLDAMRRLLAAR